jgi:hypothetical protein
MSEEGLTYITLYYDIGRKNWSTFARTFEEYFEHFKPFLNLFNKQTCNKDEMIVFIDEQFYNSFLEHINSEINIIVVSINNDFIESLPMWKTKEHEQNIMNDINFKNRLGNRSIYPEHNYAEYTLINHCKIDLISKAIELRLSTNEFYCWVDFGFFKLEENIPRRLININYFNLEKINYTLINGLNDIDKDIDHNLLYANEKIGGYFFFGRKDKLLEYQKIYHKMLYIFQNLLKIADDDQHLVLQTYFVFPEIFELHATLKWHSVFKIFEKRFNTIDK